MREKVQGQLNIVEDDFVRAEAFDQLSRTGMLTYLQGYAPEDDI